MTTHIINLYNNRQRAKRELVSNSNRETLKAFMEADSLLKREILS